MSVLEGLEPKRVFYYFEELCKIPHGSGNTKKISEYCVDFAKRQGLDCVCDEHNNVVIRKGAGAGYENHPGVIIQGHLDMVCEKEAGCDFDFSRDGLRLFTDGDYIGAHGTTLGGDDGIAIAMALAILEDKSARHPPIEALFTTDEETGMYGASGLDASLISGKILINADSENEGVLTAGCAGGARAQIELPLNFENSEKDFYKITVSGLIGGHSGIEIDKGRLNADKLLAEFLGEVGEFNLADISGGAKDNVIPNRSECIIACEKDPAPLADKFFKSRTTANDPGLKAVIERCGGRAVISAEDSIKIINMLNELPNGVQKMSEEIEGLVQTSLNLGIMEIKNGHFCASLSVRSSLNAEKAELLEKVRDICESYGASYSDSGHYPAWEFNRNSRLRTVMTDAFKRLYGREPVTEVIHAGLECGILCEKIQGLDAVSFGPDIKDIHTPRERLSVSSVRRSFEYLCEVLKSL